MSVVLLANARHDAFKVSQCASLLLGTLWAIEIWAVLTPLDTEVLNHVQEKRCPAWLRKDLGRAWAWAALCRAVSQQPNNLDWWAVQMRLTFPEASYRIWAGQRSGSDYSVHRGTCKTFYPQRSAEGGHQVCGLMRKELTEWMWCRWEENACRRCPFQCSLGLVWS